MIKIPSRFPVTFCQSVGSDFNLYSPNDLTLLSQIQYATKEDIEFLIKSLPYAAQVIKKLKAYERAEILKKVSLKIKEEASSLAMLISSEGGKPLKDAKVEVDRAALTFELCAEETLRLGGETLPMERSPSGLGHLSFTQREPIGPVLAISAFNHPLNLLAHQSGCAIAAGCPVVIKPAPATPLCAFKLQEFFLEAGLPKECLFVVNANIAEIEKLASAKEFAYVSFIGSAKVGWNLRKVIAPGTRLALEHGGVAPSIVREDADIVQAVSALTKGAFYHAGQVCISTQRIFVHKNIFSTFLEFFKKETQKLQTGDARLESTDVGPLIRKEEISRLQSWIKDAVAAGAKLELGNSVSGIQNQLLSPTILSEVPRDTKLMQEEAFGPVVCVNSYEDEAELMNYLNQSEYVFESSVFTKDISKAIHLSSQMPSMTVVINNHNAYRVDWMPFGGHKLSGLGMGGVKYSIEEMTRLKQVIIRY
jgi:acyl-CoA reductase-like NAD-dependent aldehyde dehydrogenase